MTFEKWRKQRQEPIVIAEIVKALQKLGGYASRHELIEEIRNGDNMIPEHYFDEEVISKRTGNRYKPANYVFNFAMKNLVLANYVIKPRQAVFQLTERGLTTEVTADFGEQVRRAALPYWQDKAGQNKLEVENQTDQDSLSPDEIWRQELAQALLKMHPKKFESFCRALVKEMGVKMDEKIGVSYVADGGLDGFGYITGTNDFRTSRVAIQAKRWQGNVSSPEIDKFRSAMDKFNAEYGIFITTSDFTRDAIQAARVGTRVITLINGARIADLVAKYQLFVTEVKTYELGDFYRED